MKYIGIIEYEEGTEETVEIEADNMDEALLILGSKTAFSEKKVTYEDIIDWEE